MCNFRMKSGSANCFFILLLNFVYMMMHFDRGTTPETKGTAYVVYEDIFDAKNACDHLSGFNVCNRYLVVLYYQPNKVSQFIEHILYIRFTIQFTSVHVMKLISPIIDAYDRYIAYLIQKKLLYYKSGEWRCIQPAPLI